MKKIILIGMLTISALTFADKGKGASMKKREIARLRVESSLENLTEKQREELKAMREVHRKEIREKMLDIKEVELEITTEMQRDVPRRRVINKLIDKRAGYRASMEKKMVAHRFELKEKFGIDIRGYGPNKKNYKKMRSI